MGINRYTKGALLLFIVLAGATVGLANAAPATIPNTFTAGQAAVASEVNANFDAVKTAVDDNDSRVTVNATDLANVLARITALEADNAALQNFIGNVVPYMTGGTDAQGQPAVFFSGANVHVNNGDGSTATVNGTGNLIVGYDEANTSVFAFCTVVDQSTLSAFITQLDCENNAGVWGNDPQKIGSHNLIVGIDHNYTQYGGFIAGSGNSAVGGYSSVSGGYQNNASGGNSSVSGGANRDVSGADNWRAGTLIENN